MPREPHTRRKVRDKVKTPHSLRNLTEAYVYATEVQLATLCELVRLKATSQSRIARHRAICLGMLRWCASALVDHDAVDWGTPDTRAFPRVSEILESGDIERALDALVDERSRRVSRRAAPLPPPRTDVLPSTHARAARGFSASAN